MVKSPQNDLSAYLINAVNIGIYDELEFKKIEIDDLEFFNLLHFEFNFFSENIENYMAIKEHFKFPDERYVLIAIKEKPKYIPKLDSFSITDSFLIDSLNLLINETYPINSRNEIISKSCEYLNILNEFFNSKNNHKESFENVLEKIYDIDFNENDIIKELQEYRIDYLQNPDMYFEEVNDVAFDKKCELEIERIKINQTHIQPKAQVENTLQWIGEQTEFIELSKALILNGSITGNGNQEDKINQLANLLNFKINNPYKLLNDIKTTRNNGSETLFLDKLKKTFFDYITLEKKK